MRSLEKCPVCGGELMFRGEAGRFEPTYVGRVALDLHAVPPLEGPGPQGYEARS